MSLMPPRRFVALLIALLVAPTFVQADGPATQPAKQEKPEGKEKGDKDKPDKGDNLSVTEHELKIAGQSLKYRATAGTINMKDEAGKAKADFFFVAYEKLPKSDEPSTRPITF